MPVCVRVCARALTCVYVCVGYIYANGVSELLVGVCMGLGGATGILGTFLFTRLRRRLGLEQTGVIAFSAEVTCLSLAVVSVWAPGSPFDPHFTARSQPVMCNGSSVLNYTVTAVSTANETLCDSPPRVDGVNVSVVLLLTGIIASRIGQFQQLHLPHESKNRTFALVDDFAKF